MWLYKDCDNRRQAMEVGKLRHLIHESTLVEANRSMTERWFHKGFEGIEVFSGTWTLELAETSMTE
jgi:hypothetical protein